MEILKYTVGSGENEIYEALCRSIPADDTYMRSRLSGKFLDVCEDVYFIALDGGKVASRLWMCYPRHDSAISNWGAFYTEEEYRGKGVGKRVLNFCFDEIKKLEKPPIGLFCSAGKQWLADMYSKYGFRPALKGASYGYLYCPLGDSPDNFQQFCEEYYIPAASLHTAKASFEWRNEIDCLFRFALADMGLDYSIGGEGDLYNILLNSPERGVKIILTEKKRCVGWMLDGKASIHPLYKSLL